MGGVSPVPQPEDEEDAGVTEEAPEQPEEGAQPEAAQPEAEQPVLEPEGAAEPESEPGAPDWEAEFYDDEPRNDRAAALGEAVADTARAVSGAVADAAQLAAEAVTDAAQRAGVNTDEVGSALSDAGKALGAAGKAVFRAGSTVARKAAADARPVIVKAKDKAGELWQNVRSAAATDETEAAPSDMYAAPEESAEDAEPEHKDTPET